MEYLGKVAVEYVELGLLWNICGSCCGIPWVVVVEYKVCVVVKYVVCVVLEFLVCVVVEYLRGLLLNIRGRFYGISGWRCCEISG